VSTFARLVAAVSIFGVPGAANAASSGEWPPTAASSDGRHRLELTGRLHLDGRLDPSGVAFDSGIVVRRARVGLRAEVFDRIEAELAVQYSLGAMTFENAFVGLELSDWLRLRAGQMLLPFSLQRLTTSNALVHPERAVMVEKLVGLRSVGLSLDATALDGRLELQLGVFEGTSGWPEFNRPPDLVARVKAQPSSALTFDLASRWVPPSTRGSLPNDASTSGTELAPVLRYRQGDAWRDGSRHDVSTGARLVWGSAMLQAEAMLEHTRGVQVAGQRVGDLLDWGGFLDVSWAITGERQGGEELTPTRALRPGRGPGAWQLAARYEVMVVDRRTIDAGVATGSEILQGAAGTLIWTPVSGLRLMMSYSYARLGGVAAGPVPSRDVHAVITRLDFHF
jgi:phosphate-selective porin